MYTKSNKQKVTNLASADLLSDVPSDLVFLSFQDTGFIYQYSN